MVQTGELTLGGARGTPLMLRNPVMTAAGCFGDGTEHARETWAQAPGAIVTRTLTLAPRRGSSMMRIAEARAGVVYLTDLPNRGLYATLQRAPAVWERIDPAVIVSIAGHRTDEFVVLAGELSAMTGVAALELNLDLTHYGARTDHKESVMTVRNVTQAVTAVTSLPVLVKLWPEGGVVETANAAAAGGADGVTLGHGWPASRSPVSYSATGDAPVTRLGGPAIAPLTLHVLEAMCQECPIAVIACGGIESLAGTLAALRAGAAAVQVGTALLRDPTMAARIATAWAQLDRSREAALA